MTQAAALLGLIASFLGLMAATVTLLLGGAVTAFGTSSADTVLKLGWGGVVFSLAALVASALIPPKPRGAGIALTVIAILGAVLGGTLVAICMVLALLAGILAILGARATPQRVANAESIVSTKSMAQPHYRLSAVRWILGSVFVVVGGLMFLGLFTSKDARNGHAVERSSASRAVDELESAEASDLSPSGDLAAIFELGGKHTAVQRDNSFRAVQGKVVVWELPVYDVKRNDDSYRVVTEGHILTIFGRVPMVGTRLSISPRNEAERAQIESLKTGQTIRFKGRITGITMRQLEISPAILWAALPGTEGSADTPRPRAPDAEGLAKRFLNDCKVGARANAIQFGGMTQLDATQHAEETCQGKLLAFRACVSQKANAPEACAAEANPSAE